MVDGRRHSVMASLTEVRAEPWTLVIYGAALSIFKFQGESQVGD